MATSPPKGTMLRRASLLSDVGELEEVPVEVWEDEAEEVLVPNRRMALRYNREFIHTQYTVN